MTSMLSTLIIMAAMAIIGVTLMMALSDEFEMKERDVTDLSEDDIF